MTTESPRTSTADDRPIGQLIGDIADDMSRLFRQEVALAKAEAKQEAGKAGRAAGMFAGAGVAGLMVVTLVSLALMFALAELMPIGWAAFLVAVVWAAAGAALYATGRRRLREVAPLPQTTETLKENAEWLRNPTG